MAVLDNDGIFSLNDVETDYYSGYRQFKGRELDCNYFFLSWDLKLFKGSWNRCRWNPNVDIPKVAIKYGRYELSIMDTNTMMTEPAFRVDQEGKLSAIKAIS